MADPTVRCGCGRDMRLDAIRGRGAYRCGCGATVRIAVPAPPAPPQRWTGCVGEHEDGWCPNQVTMARPLRLCADHYEASGLQQYHEWRFLKRRDMAQLVLEAEFEEWTGMPLHAFEDPETIRAVRAKVEGRQMPVPKNAVVYFIQCGEHVKIGTTANLAQRMSAFTVLPERPTLLLTVPGYHEKEKEFHRRFRHLRSHGEWFRMEGDLLAFINAATGSPDTTAEAV